MKCSLDNRGAFSLILTPGTAVKLCLSSTLSLSTSTSTWSRTAPRVLWKASIDASMECSCRMQVRRTSQTTQTIPDILSNFQLRAFLDKYVVCLQEDSYNYLICYLQSDKNTALCKVLAVHIPLDVQSAKRTVYQLYASGGSSRSESSSLEPPDVPNPILQNEAALEVLQESIKRVKDGPSSLTTICFYAFYNSEQLLNTAEISSDNKLLAAGFDNSCIKL